MTQGAQMMLRMVTEEGSTLRSIQKVEQAQRALTVEIVKGNQASRMALMTEKDRDAVLARLTAAEKRKEEAAKKAAEAEKERARLSRERQKSAALEANFRATEREAEAARKAAAAEAALAQKTRERSGAQLQAQKSAALLSQMTEKATREKRMAVGWESALAKAQFEADTRNQARLRKRTEEAARAQEAQRGALVRGASSAVAFAGSLAGIATGAAVATGAIRALTAAHEHQMDVAKRSDQQARGLKEFISLQAEGEEGKKHVQATLAKGASMGLTPEQTAQIAQPIQSVVDKDGDGRLNAEEKAAFDEDTTAAFGLAQLGISPEDAQTVITSGRSKGKGGRESADKLALASDLSAAGPADFARAASAMGQFSDGDTALAVATALTQEEKNFEQIPTLVRGAALALGSASDDSELSKKFGLKGLSEADKIAKLRERGKTEGKGATEEERIADFSRSLKNYGLDEEKARAVGILVRQGDTVASTREKLGGVEAGLTERKVAALAADPLVGSAMGADQAAASAALDKLYGVDADEARDKRAAALALGAELQRYGGGWAVDPETGEEKGIFNPGTWAGRAVAMWNGMPGTGLNGQGTNQDDSLSGQEKLAIQLELLNKSLQENTAATQANSTSAKASRPAPVEGEKY